MYVSKAKHKAINSRHGASVIYEMESLSICLVKKDFVLFF